MGPINVAHAAGAELRDYLVRPDRRADLHGERGIVLSVHCRLKIGDW
jgi:hypothetical protein